MDTRDGRDWAEATRSPDAWELWSDARLCDTLEQVSDLARRGPPNLYRTRLADFIDHRVIAENVSGDELRNWMMILGRCAPTVSAHILGDYLALIADRLDLCERRGRANAPWTERTNPD